MKRKFLAVMALVLTVAVAQAQEIKIGFTNIDAIVFSMPEIPRYAQNWKHTNNNLVAR